jgi:hypothetical protein
MAKEHQSEHQLGRGEHEGRLDDGRGNHDGGGTGGSKLGAVMAMVEDESTRQSV